MVEERSRLSIFIGHYLGFISNLVTAAPAESHIPSVVLQMFLASEPLVVYIVEKHFENNPDSDYEKSILNSAIHVPLLVLFYNSTCNSSELRGKLIMHQNG